MELFCFKLNCGHAEPACRQAGLFQHLRLVANCLKTLKLIQGNKVFGFIS